MPADLRLIDPESGGPLPADLFGDVNLAAPKMTLRRVWVRNVGDVPAVQVLVEVSGGIEVSSDGPFGGRVRLLDIPPGGGTAGFCSSARCYGEGPSDSDVEGAGAGGYLMDASGFGKVSIGVRVLHADGTVTDLGVLDGRLTLRQRIVLWCLRRRQQKEE